MVGLTPERVLSVHHWNASLFSFATTRDAGFRFESGQFVMIGLMADNKPLLRAYSIASPSWAEHLEFLSIKVPDGRLTTRLQNLCVGDELLVGRKPTGTLVVSDLLPGPRLFLFGTGTGLAPFMSVIRDPHTYERFDQVILVHGVRYVGELAYRDYIQGDLKRIDGLEEEIARKLIYFPTVTREQFPESHRITHLIEGGRLCARLGIGPLDPRTDRAMLCGNLHMLGDVGMALSALGFQISSGIGRPAHYVIERSFVER